MVTHIGIQILAAVLNNLSKATLAAEEHTDSALLS